ncbi:DUF6491 family protein [Sphingomonas sp. G-3-2-10]|jgi:hypothetical protein|uniref:DUF6491 family protein n=1 Tax=Sphingomonas sp. G-3-2-10 TaxID=2728838 RepID=UPI00146CB174|nr:DUF6491 family protein [Sphingomonas sp. G-3-2-10]NML07731.1 hypothetical protein [Sphingomonas sp. G-3-2-10]
MSARFAAALVPALLIAGAAAAQTAGPKSGEQADIPFATNGGIRTFTPDDRGNGVYLQDRRNNWYYASLAGPCMDLPFATRIGYRTFGGSSTLSRGDTIFTEREQCLITDLVRSGPPPKKERKPKAKKKG